MEIWRVAEGFFFHFFSLVKKSLGMFQKGLKIVAIFQNFVDVQKRPKTKP
jgi:hypothetical protein